MDDGDRRDSDDDSHPLASPPREHVHGGLAQEKPQDNEPRTSRAPDSTTDWIQTFLAGAILFAGIAQIFVSCQQHNAMSESNAVAARAADAAKSAADTAAAQLEISERPWVSATFTIREPLTFDANGRGGMWIAVTLKNGGGSVALNVRTRMRLYAGITNRIHAEQAALCDPMRTAPRLIPETALFPGGEAEFHEGIDVAPEDIAEAKSRMPRMGNLVDFTILSCIDYQSPLGPKHFQTRYVFGLGRAHESGKAIIGFLKPEGTLSDVGLVHWIEGNSAD